MASSEKIVSKSLLVLHWVLKAVVAIIASYALVNLWFAISVTCPPPGFGNMLLAMTLMVVGIGAGVIVLDRYVFEKLINKLSKKTK